MFKLSIDLAGNPVQECTPESLKRRPRSVAAVGMPKAARLDQGNCFSTVGDDFGMSDGEREGVISMKYWEMLGDD